MIQTALAVAVSLILRSNVQLYVPGSSTQGGGITSLKHLRNNENGEWLILCGTKKGSLQVLSLIDNDPIDCCVRQCTEFNLTSGKYPIFSMAVNEDDRAVFCGGSDRFVTILQLAPDEQHYTGADGSLLLGAKQRLGPHTGWVQDVLLVSPKLLYSIGCNCIESWQKQSNQAWTQGKPLVIDSDIELGCTLSSDLLCLAYKNGYLFAGGVDGRIHAFGKRERSAIAAHTGRVNALITTTTEGVDHVVSGSHDGWVSKWRLQPESTGGMTLTRVKAIQTEERNTAVLAIQMHKNSNEESFVVGTNQGTILHLSNSLDLLGTFHLPQPALITAFLHIPHFKMVLVAHSRGLGAFHYQMNI